MKRNLYVFVFISFFILLFLNPVNAQYCGNSGAGICTPGGPYPALGFYPPYDSVPCVEIGVPFVQYVDVQIPPTVIYAGAPRTLNWVKVNSVSNLPCGMCWSSDVANNTFPGNSTHCIKITGTTYDAPGQYKLAINIDAQAVVLGLPFTLTNQNAEDFGIKYWARVENLDGTCITVDTLATGNTAHTVGSIPAITLVGTTSVCTGGSSTFTISNAASYYAYKWSTGATTASINVSTGGTYTVTAYAACASATASRTLTVTAPPSPTIVASGPTTFCAGGSVVLDAGAGFSSYTWSTGATSRTITVSQSGNYTATVVQNGCTGTTNTVTVTVNANPTPVISPWSATTFCAGGDVWLDAGGGYSSYLWSTGETVQGIIVSQSGNYTVTVTQNGCAGSSSPMLVTVNANPTPTITAGGPIAFCAGGSVTLSAGAGYSTYAWSNGSSAQSINVTQSGNYTCTVSQNGCFGASNTIAVTVNPIPTPAITPTGATSFCLGDSVRFDAGAGYSSYLWSTGETSQGIIVKQTGSYIVTVVQNGCTGPSTPLSVSVTDPTPTITPNGPTTFCTGGSVTLDAGTGFSTYAWSDATSSQTTVATQSGTYTVTTMLNGCIGVSNPLTITVATNNLAPAIIATPSLNICPGGNVTLDVGAGYDAYTWSTSATSQTITAGTSATYSVTVTQGTCSGTAAATVNVGSFPVTVNVTPAGPVSACEGDVVMLNASGTYDTYAWSNGSSLAGIAVTVSGSYALNVTSNSCTGTDTVEVIFHPLPQPVISPVSPINACNGDVVTLDGGASTGIFAWSNGAQTQTIQPVSSGSYSVTVVENGCAGSDTAEVTFFAHPVVSISPAGPVVACEGDAVTLDAGAGYDTYVWSSFETTQTIQPSSSDTFEVTVTLNGCEGTAAVEVIVNPLPAPGISPASPVSACVGDNVILNAGNGYDSYLWSNGDLSQTTQPTASGDYSVTVTQSGCNGSDTASVVFTATPHPTIIPSDTQTICSGSSITLDAGAGFDSYIWTTGATTQTITVNTAGDYDVIVTDNTCAGDAVSPVTVNVNTTPVAEIDTVIFWTWGVFNDILIANTVSGGSYEWLYHAWNDSLNVVSLGNDNDSLTINCNDGGYYAVVVSSLQGCSDTSAFILVPVCEGVNDIASEINFNLQPNPASSMFLISYELPHSTKLTALVLDITGRRVLDVLNEKQTAGAHLYPVKIDDLAPGIYLLNLTTEAGSVNAKFVKQ